MNLNEAKTHPQRAFLALSDLSATDDEIQATVRRWQELCGLTDKAMLDAAEQDVRGDCALYLAINSSNAELLEFLETDDLSIYYLGEITSNEEWAQVAVNNLKRQMELVLKAKFKLVTGEYKTV